MIKLITSHLSDPLEREYEARVVEQIEEYSYNSEVNVGMGSELI